MPDIMDGGPGLLGLPGHPDRTFVAYVLKGVMLAFTALKL